MNIIRIPNGPIDQGNNISALNNHLNFIRAKNTILMPFYGIPEDDLAVRTIKGADPHIKVIPVKAY